MFKGALSFRAVSPPAPLATVAAQALASLPAPLRRRVVEDVVQSCNASLQHVTNTRFTACDAGLLFTPDLLRALVVTAVSRPGTIRDCLMRQHYDLRRKPRTEGVAPGTRFPYLAGTRLPVDTAFRLQVYRNFAAHAPIPDNLLLLVLSQLCNLHIAVTFSVGGRYVAVHQGLDLGWEATPHTILLLHARKRFGVFSAWQVCTVEGVTGYSTAPGSIPSQVQRLGAMSFRKWRPQQAYQRLEPLPAATEEEAVTEGAEAKSEKR